MKTVSMHELRVHAEKILAQVQNGERMVLTRRGKPVARLEPIEQPPVGDDPFYSLDRVGDVAGESLSNSEIDDLLDGQ